MELLQNLLGIEAGLAVWTLLKILAIVAPLMIGVAYLTLAERKVIGYMQIRIGPNRVGPKGLLQPLADGVKLLMKEIILPTKSSKGLFLVAPVLSIMPALAAWAVIPFTDTMVLANIDASLLFIMAITSSEWPRPLQDRRTMMPRARRGDHAESRRCNTVTSCEESLAPVSPASTTCQS